MKRLNFTGILLMTLLAAVTVSNSVAQQLQLEDVIAKGTFKHKTVNALRSMKDGMHYSTLENDGKEIVKYSYKYGKKVETILNIEEISPDTMGVVVDYEFNADETKVLLTTDKKSLYRWSFTAQYYIYNFLTSELVALSKKGAQQLATFSPDGERVAFVRENDLFMKSIRFGTERQITNDGEYNKVINGAPDWVYEEEFSFNKAFEWSPDSKKLAFLKFNEEGVKTFDMPIYKGEAPEKNDNGLYPGEYSFKYPKAGEANSVVEVYVYDLKAKQSIQVDTGDDTDIYIPRIKWTVDGNDLAVFRLNRLQNKFEMVFANPFTGDTRIIYTEKNERYIDEDLYDKLTFFPNKKQFVVLSEKDGYNHLYLYDFTGTKIKQLTEGEFDVTDYYGYDPLKKLFYYQAAAVSPMQREVYAVSLDLKKRYKISTKKGTNSAIFSEGYKYYINYFNNMETPMYVTLHDYKKKQIRVLEDNKELNEKLKQYDLPVKEFFSFKTSEGVELNGSMIKPSDFEENKKYPVVLIQYSGPNSQEVLDNYSIGWGDYLAQNGYIVVTVDPRGTGGRGEEFKKSTYMQLGNFEHKDQVETANYIGTLPYVDKNNIGIWGWSYGGFITSLCMTRGEGTFKAGIAVAPITNWRYYDTVYTERFMRRPQDNPEGYDENSPVNYCDGLQGELLLVHGSADDNVHLQNSAEFAEGLVQAGKQFEMMIYTNRNHNINGGNTRLHLYTMFTDFLNENLKSE
jgi:dipeptidyl-peptidase-4